MQEQTWFTTAELTNVIDSGTGKGYGIPINDPLAHTGTLADQIVAANGGILASTWGQPNCSNGCTPL
jgi:hypothetical protein